MTTDAPPAQWRILLGLLFLPDLVKYGIQILVAPFFPAVMATRRRQRQRALARAPRRGVLDAGSAPSPRSQPRISVLVPAWNEEVGIAATVRAILDSRYTDFEVVVINDGSTDRTDEVMRALVAEHQASGHPARLVYERKPNGGKASAMNRALELASGELVITTDADSVMAPDALTHFARQFEDPTVMSVSGNVKIGNAVGIIGLVQQLEYMYGFWFKKADALMGSMYIVGGAAAAYRRRVFDTLPRTKDRTVFDERNITEDIEMSTRIQDAGHRISYAPDAVIHTEGPTEWKAFARQRLRWKYGRFLTFLQYRHLFFSTRRPQKAWLTMLVLPVALLSEFLLLLEPLTISLMWGYALVTHDLLPGVVYIMLTTLLLVFQVLTDSRRRENANLLLVAPFAWVLFYLVDAVEFTALVRSLKRLATGRGVTWQRWQRKGVFAQTT